MTATMTKWFTAKLGGAFNQNDNLDMLSNGATKLIEDALEGFETSEPIIDYNVQVVGTGTSGAGLYVHGSVGESVWKHPVANVKMKLLESACAIKDASNWDANYTQRLMALKTMITKSHGAVWGRQCVYGLDQYHDRAGNAVPANTAVYVPNAYVYELAQDHPAHYVPCASIHPYRADAVDELRKWIKRGVKVVKWIPSVQGIDPSNERCDKFYGLMAQHGIILHSGGDRVLIDPPGFDISLENPLLLRRPLSFGVKVIISHCASEGKSLDLEFPPHALVDNLSLFLRMMEEPKYVGLLFGDISGICNFTRVECLLPLLDNTELHKRLVYGSNYPVTAINLVVQTYWFANKGLVSEKECDWIGEIYKINPLLFDFVMKRTLKSKKGNKFNISVFKEHPDLQISKIQLVDLTDDDPILLNTEQPPPKAPTPPPVLQTSILAETESPIIPPPSFIDSIKIAPSIFAPSPKFSITTPPSPAVRADPDRLAPSFDDNEDAQGEEGEEEEGFTEEEIEL